MGTPRLPAIRPSDESPFDQFKHVDEYGEYWLGRELMPLFGYDQWRNFAACIERAKISAQTNGTSVTSNFADVSKISTTKNGADVRLTRLAAYLTAMEGDPSKPEIAAAKHYFAAKTGEAERVDRMDEDLLAIVNMTKAVQQNRDDLRKLQAIQLEHGRRQEVIEARLDTVEGNHGWVSALGYAKVHKLPTETRYLQRIGVKATNLAKRRGIAIGKVDHPLYGKANTYPEELLAEVFGLVPR